MASIKKDWEDLNLSQDEVNNLTKALENEEFRKLLIEYVEETQKPESRQKYQDDIVQLEAERGIDCTFINPTPCFVVKTSIDGKGKAFINIASNHLIGKITAEPVLNHLNASGRPVSIPYSLAPGRDDFDKKNNSCIVYDAIFHPETIELALKKPEVKSAVIQTALSGVETEFKVKLDKRNIKLPKLKYKGAIYAAVIRKPSLNPPEITEEDIQFREQMKYPPMPDMKNQGAPKIHKSEPVSAFTSPHYVIKYRNDIDLQEYTFDRNAKIHAAIPKELVIEIYLPMLNSSKNVKLDVSGKLLDLICETPAKYKLNICLPYHVSDDGSAKFDVDLKRLIVTLPVVRKENPVDLVREDSGVESDVGDQMSQEAINEPLVKPVESNGNTSFLSCDQHYVFPTYDYNRENNSICFVLNVKNVDPGSVMQNQMEKGFQLKFTSIGSGYFPINYAFCAIFENPILEDLTVETWDNNVTVRVHLTSLKTEDSLWVGLSEEDVQERRVDSILDLSDTIDSMKIDEAFLEDNPINVLSADSEEVVFEVEFKGSSLSNDEDDEQFNTPLSKTRTYSEGSGDEMVQKEKAFKSTTPVVSGPCADKNESDSFGMSVNVPCTNPVMAQSKKLPVHSNGVRKSILKNRLNRSLSESCADAASFDSGVLYTYSDSCLPEREEGREVKKTVRFSQKIQQQVFRANSSILGQRKKNQKRTRNRRKALERRASESENSEGEEREKWLKKGQRKNEEEIPVINTVIAEETADGARIQNVKRKKSRKHKSIELIREVVA